MPTGREQGEGVPQAIWQALQLHQEGRLADAERLYREVLRRSGRDFEALHLLGVLKMQQGQAQEAVRLLAVAVEVDPASAAAHSNYGLALAALKRNEEAFASYGRSLALAPRNAEVLSNRADTLCDLGRREEALADYDQALAIAPRLMSALVNRGILLREMGRFAEALAAQEKALAVDGNDAEAWNHRGIVLQDLDRHAEALACYDRALSLRREYAEALFNRGNALLTLKRPAEALASYTSVIALTPNRPDVYNSRGHALLDLGKFDEALMNYDKALSLQPDFYDAMLNRAEALSKLERHAEALAGLERLFAQQPNTPRLLSALGHCRAITCDWSHAAQTQTLLTDAVAAGVSVDPFLFLGVESTAEQQLACAKNWLKHKKTIAVAREFKPADFPSDKIKVVYVSADYHRDATAHLIAELFELHDRERFEIIGLSFGPDDRSERRSRLVKSFDRFFDVTTRTNGKSAKLIHDLKTHIAVDLNGYTTDGRINIFAQRQAPIQVSYLGYPGTVGADFIDYVIADRIVLPFDQQPFYPEKIVHLPDTYQVNDSKRRIASPAPSRREVGLPESGFVFCCFNNTWKITPSMFDVWMRLLHSIEGGVIWLYETNRHAAENLRAEASARGIDPARIVFAPPLDLPDHLARVQLADLFLDTLPYSGNTTASDALWAGVPVLTCLGPTFQGRVAASLLDAIGLRELTTNNLADYEALASKLATEPALLNSIRGRLAQNRRTHPLFDTGRFCRYIEAAYMTMWDIWRRSERPKPFAVEPFHAISLRPGAG